MYSLVLHWTSIEAILLCIVWCSNSYTTSSINSTNCSNYTSSNNSNITRHHSHLLKWYLLYFVLIIFLCIDKIVYSVIFCLYCVIYLLFFDIFSFVCICYYWLSCILMVWFVIFGHCNLWYCIYRGVFSVALISFGD